MLYVVRFRTPIDEALAWLSHQSGVALKPPRTEWHATLIPTFEAGKDFSIRDFVGGMAEAAELIPCYRLTLDSLVMHPEGEKETRVISIRSNETQTNEWYRAAIGVCAEKLPSISANQYDLHVALKTGQPETDALRAHSDLVPFFEEVRVLVRSCRILCRQNREQDWQSIGAFDLRG